eukprot:scpid38199/ scgid3685/ 
MATHFLKAVLNRPTAIMSWARQHRALFMAITLHKDITDILNHAGLKQPRQPPREESLDRHLARIEALGGASARGEIAVVAPVPGLMCQRPTAWPVPSRCVWSPEQLTSGEATVQDVDQDVDVDVDSGPRTRTHRGDLAQVSGEERLMEHREPGSQGHKKRNRKRPPSESQA